jgi:hypothetical protein
LSSTVVRVSGFGAKLGLLCISAIPAVTGAVDEALADALVDLQGSLPARTGIAAR